LSGLAETAHSASFMALVRSGVRPCTKVVLGDRFGKAKQVMSTFSSEKYLDLDK
jgi:hypothetical protein